MRAYVLGTGASFPIYPLGGGLFQAIDDHIKRCSPCFDRFHYETDWPNLKEWLGTNSNPLLRQAYRNGNIEQIFTVLDLAEGLISGSPSDILIASKKGAAAVKAAEANHGSLTNEIGEYRRQRNILLWAMEAFFLGHNDDDFKNFGSEI